MPRGRKPQLARGPASPFAGPFEVIREFGATLEDGRRVGGLLSLTNLGDRLVVEPYRLDEGVVVRVDAGHLEARGG